MRVDTALKEYKVQRLGEEMWLDQVFPLDNDGTGTRN